MTFGEKIREARHAKNMTQKELADKIGAKHNSISNWEKNQNRPDPDAIELICGVLGITPNYLLNIQEDNTLTLNERELLDSYRQLDSHAKRLTFDVINRELSRISKYGLLDAPKVTIPQTRFIHYYQRLASAGTGQIIFDTPPTSLVEIPISDQYKKVSYAIGVNGDSMSPIYQDGDILLVEMAEEIHMNEIGIFMVDGECYVKKLGDQELISLNDQYCNIPLNEYSKCFGKVIGKL